jgi:hypothetical protein
MGVMLGMWTPTATAAAEKEFGERNYRWLMLWRSLPLAAVAAVLGGAAWAAREGWHAWQAWDAPPLSLSLGWSPWWLAPAALVAVVVLWRRRDPYRLPRRWYGARRY